MIQTGSLVRLNVERFEFKYYNERHGQELRATKRFFGNHNSQTKLLVYVYR